MNRSETEVKLLTFLLLHGLHQKLETKAILPGGKFWGLFSERFHGLLEFVHSVDNKSYNEATYDPK
jgi:hypothetical protein